MRDLSKKAQYVKEFKTKIEKAKVIVLTSIEGVSVDQMTLLRKNLRQGGDEMRVAKNALLRRAFHELKLEGLDPFTIGSTAVTFGYSDPVTPVKVLFDFAEKAQKFRFKGGLLGHSLLTVAQLEHLSKLPGRKELLGMLLSTMVGPVRNMLSVCQGPVRSFLYALQAIREQKEKAAAA